MIVQAMWQEALSYLLFKATNKYEREQHENWNAQQTGLNFEQKWKKYISVLNLDLLFSYHCKNAYNPYQSNTKEVCISDKLPVYPAQL